VQLARLWCGGVGGPSGSWAESPLRKDLGGPPETGRSETFTRLWQKCLGLFDGVRMGAQGCAGVCRGVWECVGVSRCVGVGVGVGRLVRGWWEAGGAGDGDGAAAAAGLALELELELGLDLG
jgi:hypothetical protein